MHRRALMQRVFNFDAVSMSFIAVDTAFAPRPGRVHFPDHRVLRTATKRGVVKIPTTKKGS